MENFLNDIVPDSTGLESDGHEADTRERRDLLVMRAARRDAGGGALRFAVFADEAEGVTAGGLAATPLPGAPPAVLGVVCVRGRMKTLLDPSLLWQAPEVDERAATPGVTAARLAGEARRADVEPGVARARFVVALRGDEQLALAVEEVETIREIFVEAIEPPGPETASCARGVLSFDEHSPATGSPPSRRIIVLDPAHIFEAALRETERRRPRT